MTRISNIVPLSKTSMAQRCQFAWRQFIKRLIAERAQMVGHEIEQHLEHHRYELSPEIRIELERHCIGRDSHLSP
jgi:hypothetical protein